MHVLTKIASLFENWLDPLAQPENLRPPADIVRFFIHYLSQAKLPFLAVLVLGGLGAFLEALFFYYVGRLVDILDGSDISAGWQGLVATHGSELLTMLLVVLVARFVITAVSALVDEQVINRSFYNLVRWQSYLYVARQSMSFFSNEFSGSVVTKVTQAGGSLGDFVMGFLQAVWTVLIFTATTMVLFAQMDWRLAVIIAVWLAIFIVLARYFIPRMRQRAAQTAEASAALNGRVVDSYANIQTIKLFGKTKDSDAYVRSGFENFLSASLHLGRIVIGVRAAMTLLSGVMITAIAALSIDLWSQGLISVGAVAFAMALVLRLNMWLGRLMGALNGLMRNFGTVQNAMETISQPLGVVDVPNAVAWTPEKGNIQFADVCFQYSPRHEVIDDLSFNIQAGEKIGLIGKSGAGKTTIVNLLLRFYDLDSGQILIDGHDIAEVQQDTLRAGIGVVTQDTSLLHRSVRANIKYGRPEATDDDMIAAAKQAEAHDFIAGLQDSQGRKGYDAHVGERGVKLSGGQRQRVAIARVLLKNAPVLVLDEATSALDSEVEAAIQSQLETLMRGKTTIAIAHRLSTIAAMDRLIVLDAGKIVEMGSHATLLRKNGHYAKLWKRQSGGFLLAENAEGKAEV